MAFKVLHDKDKSLKLNYCALQFNPIHWHILDALNDPSIRHIKLYGGSSAGKTYEVVQVLAINGESQNFSSIVFRKEGSSMHDSIMNDFKEVNENLKLNMKLQQFRMIYLNGHVIRFRGLDKADKVKGLKGYRVAMLDELDHFEYRDYREMRRRMRGMHNMKLIYTWNPVDEEHWIKQKVIDKDVWIEQPKKIEGLKYSELGPHSQKWENELGNTVLIKTNYLDNHWIVGHPTKNPRYGKVEQGTIDEFEIMRISEPNDYQVYALGNWGKVKTGLEYFHNFQYERHVKPQEAENKLVNVIFDFNVTPYMSALIVQVTYNKEGRVKICFKQEYAMKPPVNSIEQTCQAVLRDWGHLIKQHSIHIYGDATGNNRLPIYDNLNLYDFVIKGFKGIVTRDHMRLARRNPNFRKNSKGSLGRHHIVNRIFYGEDKSLPIDIEIDPKCDNLIKDLNVIQMDASGGKVKVRVTDKQSKASYEKYGHMSDCLEYFLMEFVSQHYNIR